MKKKETRILPNSTSWPKPSSHSDPHISDPRCHPTMMGRRELSFEKYSPSCSESPLLPKEGACRSIFGLRGGMDGRALLLVGSRLAEEAALSIQNEKRREVARTGVGVVPVPKSPFLLFVLRGRRAYLNIPSCLLADNSIHLACAHSITKEIYYFCHMVIILFSYNWKVYRGEGRTKTRCFILLSLFFLSPLHYSYLT